MNPNFQCLRHEILETFGCETPAEGRLALPPLSRAEVDTRAVEDWQVRFYHLWERVKLFAPDNLDDHEACDREYLATHLERSLDLLHGTRPTS